MVKDFSRTERVADVIQHELAGLIQAEMGDPRLKLVTVTAVQVTRDLAHAKIYITQPVDESKINIAVKILNKAAKHLRYRLAQLIKLRTMPELKFVYDESIRHGSHLSAMIDQAIEEDEKKHQS